MKKLFLLLLLAFAIVGCESSVSLYSDGKNLSVNEQCYFSLTKVAGDIDTTFVAFSDNTFYQHNSIIGLYSNPAGTYYQEKEVVKVLSDKGMLPVRVFISYGDFLLCQGVYYQSYQ